MRQILKRIVETLVVIFGNCIYAFGIAMFILPSGLITGGTTGIALFVNDVFHTPVTVFVFVFNTIMFLIGFFAFGCSSGPRSPEKSGSRRGPLSGSCSIVPAPGTAQRDR